MSPRSTAPPPPAAHPQQQGASRAVARPKPIILFTAFEPSGDALAAPVIAELRRREPGLHIVAIGGPLMRAAGAELLSETVEGATMGTASWRRAGRVRAELKRLRRWVRDNRLQVHVPVDSPAANFPICRMLRRRAACRTVHLAAPQIWAWGRGRIRKMRRLSDMVLCLLPFEEQWFNDRGVPARFIGHPAINRTIDEKTLRQHLHGLPQGNPRLAIFPGSRRQEIAANLKLLMNTFIELRGRHSGMSGLIVAASPELATYARKKLGTFPNGVHMTTGQVDEALTWCDLALAVSGTVTLHITRHAKPMIGVYKTGVGSWLGSKLLLRTRYKLLPNIIAEQEIVPEYVPYAGGAAPLVREASRLLHDSRNLAMQTEQLRRVVMRFANKQPAREAAEHILEKPKG